MGGKKFGLSGVHGVPKARTQWPKVIAENSWGFGGAVSPPAGPGQRPVGVRGAKPPEAPDILSFLRPQNGLGSFNFSSCLC